MENQAILDELLEVLEHNGTVLRREALGGGGSGLCRLKDKKIFFVDTESSAIENARNCAKAISELMNIESIYVRPQVRRFIEDCIGVNK